MKFSFQSTKFAAELQRRLESIAGGPRVMSGLLHVPPELAWWYWQEFGTAGPYDIDPVNAKVLSWPTPEGRAIAHHVKHPGIKPRRFVTDSLPEIRQKMAQDFMAVFTTFNPELYKQALLTSTLPEAKKIIVSAIEDRLPGTRIDGKLAGDTAANTFDSAATITDVST